VHFEGARLAQKSFGKHAHSNAPGSRGLLLPVLQQMVVLGKQQTLLLTVEMNNVGNRQSVVVQRRDLCCANG
jgi:hypothetical protein